MDRKQHYDEMQESASDKARAEFLRKPYGVADQLAKWGVDLKKGVGTSGQEDIKAVQEHAKRKSENTEEAGQAV
ncbi:MAG: hypothetical protein PHW34_13430 [Hespellia sp.]|nr:hypothetical protein [Hespellia sp.]